MTLPTHVVVRERPDHGVSILADQLARELGAPTVDPADLADLGDRSGPDGPSAALHVHFTDRLFGATPARAADAVVALARRRRTTLTLHDVPQPTDGASFESRRRCYARVLDAAAGWATSSRTERCTVQTHCAPASDGVVVPLPVVTGPLPAPAPPATPTPVPGPPTLGVFGWVYPGKGHALAIDAAARLADGAGCPPTVVALGAVADGHGDLADELRARADEAGVGFELTGWLTAQEATARLATTTVGLVAHANLSASGSLNSWLAAGRRPLVRDGGYTREMHELRPGTLELVPAEVTPAELARRVRVRIDYPGLGRLAPGADLRPLLADTAAAYAHWWAEHPGAGR